MNPRLLVTVGLLLVIQTELPDVAAQLTIDQASPYTLIGLRALALAVAIALNLMDPMGRIRQKAEVPPAIQEPEDPAPVVAAPEGVQPHG